jgi:aromatic ring-opening dioxygenase catalytic subunit (LigB family)
VVSSSSQRLPTVFIPHGGGPCFFMDPPASAPQLWDRLGAFLRGLGTSIGTRPRALLVISAHWENAKPTVNSGAQPPMLFDYHGFPEHTYRLRYPAPGSPALAGRVRELLGANAIESSQDAERGYDHGVFVPLLLAYPDADIPIVQLSLQTGLDPATHLAMGRALAPLREEGVLIIGSGMSYHNLREFFSTSASAMAAAERFDGALNAAVETADPEQREAALAAWQQMPDAIACHPRAEHLLPLLVAAGAAADDAGRRVYHDHLFGKALSAWQFG